MLDSTEKLLDIKDKLSGTASGARRLSATTGPILIMRGLKRCQVKAVGRETVVRFGEQLEKNQRVASVLWRGETTKLKADG